MAERKIFSGDRDAAVDYLRIGRNLLAQMRAAMQLNNLQVLQRTVTLANGVTITVASVFGQDTIDINVSPNLPRAVIDDVNALVEELRDLPPHGYLTDTVTLTSEVSITKTDVIPASPGTPSVILVTGGDGVDTKASLTETVGLRSTITINIKTPSTTTTPQTSPSVIIAGGTQGGDAFVWDDVNGYYRVNKNDTFFSQKRNATIFGMSADGTVLVGSVEIYDSNVNPATINPFTGGGGTAIGWVALAARWASKYDSVQLAHYVSGGGASEARTTDSSGTVRGVWAGSGMSWDGRNNHNMTLGGTVPSRATLVSPDNAVTVSGSNYKLNGATKTWRGLGGSSAPNDAVVFCVVHLNAAPATTTVEYITTTVVFSA